MTDSDSTDAASTSADPAPGDSASAERVGSVAEEAFKLFRALNASSSAGAPAGATPSSAGVGHEPQHACTTAWCPVCQVVGFVRDNPDAFDQVAQSAAQLTRSLRDLLDSALTPREEP